MHQRPCGESASWLEPGQRTCLVGRVGILLVPVRVACAAAPQAKLDGIDSPMYESACTGIIL